MTLRVPASTESIKVDGEESGKWFTGDDDEEDGVDEEGREETPSATSLGPEQRLTDDVDDTIEVDVTIGPGWSDVPLEVSNETEFVEMVIPREDISWVFASLGIGCTVCAMPACISTGAILANGPTLAGLVALEFGGPFVVLTNPNWATLPCILLSTIVALQPLWLLAFQYSPDFIEVPDDIFEPITSSPGAESAHPEDRGNKSASELGGNSSSNQDPARREPAPHDSDAVRAEPKEADHSQEPGTKGNDVEPVGTPVEEMKY